MAGFATLTTRQTSFNRPLRAGRTYGDLRFVLGHTPLEFRDTLHMLADGKVNVAPLITRGALRATRPHSRRALARLTISRPDPTAQPQP